MPIRPRVAAAPASALAVLPNIAFRPPACVKTVVASPIEKATVVATPLLVLQQTEVAEAVGHVRGFSSADGLESTSVSRPRASNVTTPRSSAKSPFKSSYVMSGAEQVQTRVHVLGRADLQLGAVDVSYQPTPSRRISPATFRTSPCRPRGCPE